MTDLLVEEKVALRRALAGPVIRGCRIYLRKLRATVRGYKADQTMTRALGIGGHWDKFMERGDIRGYQKWRAG